MTTVRGASAAREPERSCPAARLAQASADDVLPHRPRQRSHRRRPFPVAFLPPVPAAAVSALPRRLRRVVRRARPFGGPHPRGDGPAADPAPLPRRPLPPPPVPHPTHAPHAA